MVSAPVLPKTCSVLNMYALVRTQLTQEIRGKDAQCNRLNFQLGAMHLVALATIRYKYCMFQMDCLLIFAFIVN